MCISSLFTFSVLIGSLRKYLETKTTRLEIIKFLFSETIHVKMYPIKRFEHFCCRRGSYVHTLKLRLRYC